MRFSHWFMSMNIPHLKDHSFLVHQDIYATSAVAKCLDTVPVDTSEKLNKTNFQYYIIFIKNNPSTRYNQVEKLTREFNINYRACIGSFIYLFSNRVDLIFEVHKLAKFHQIIVK